MLTLTCFCWSALFNSCCNISKTSERERKDSSSSSTRCWDARRVCEIKDRLKAKQNNTLNCSNKMNSLMTWHKVKSCRMLFMKSTKHSPWKRLDQNCHGNMMSYHFMLANSMAPKPQAINVWLFVKKINMSVTSFLINLITYLAKYVYAFSNPTSYFLFNLMNEIPATQWFLNFFKICKSPDASYLL